MRKSKIEGMKLSDEQRKLVENNHGLIFYTLKMKNLSFEQYYDIAAIALCKAAILYNPKIGNFSTYACTCIARNIDNYWKIENAQKRKGNKTILYYDDLIENEDKDSPGSILATLKSNFSTEDEVMCKIAYETAYSNLTKKSQKVFSFIMKYGTKEAAQKLNRTRARTGAVYTEFKKSLLRELSIS